MEQLHFITKLLDIKDPNIQILDIINKDTHKEIIAKLDYDASGQSNRFLTMF
ncbi:transposase [Streptococcus pneumoniae]|nr:transposase [Streptococcus pneumoniae]